MVTAHHHMRKAPKFENEVIRLSASATYPQAQFEWRRIGRKRRIPVTCPCGRRILNVFFVRNRKTGATVPMGRGCAKRLFTR